MRKVALIVAAILVLLSDVALGQTDKDQDCASSLDRPIYPRLARLSGMTGVVSASFVVGTSDQAENIQLSEHPILAAEVGKAVRRTGFLAACQSHTVTLNFKFVLEGELADQPTTSVVFKSPNEYIVTSYVTGIICALNAT